MAWAAKWSAMGLVQVIKAIKVIRMDFAGWRCAAVLRGGASATRGCLAAMPVSAGWRAAAGALWVARQRLTWARMGEARWAESEARGLE